MSPPLRNVRMGEGPVHDPSIDIPLVDVSQGMLSQDEKIDHLNVERHRMWELRRAAQAEAYKARELVKDEILKQRHLTVGCIDESKGPNSDQDVGGACFVVFQRSVKRTTTILWIPKKDTPSSCIGEARHPEKPARLSFASDLSLRKGGTEGPHALVFSRSTGTFRRF